METNLRDAKSRFSELVRLAAQGEEIVITVRGVPTARLVSIAAPQPPQPDREQWMTEVARVAEGARMGTPKNTRQDIWDEMRAERQ